MYGFGRPAHNHCDADSGPSVVGPSAIRADSYGRSSADRWMPISTVPQRWEPTASSPTAYGDDQGASF